MTFEFSFTCYGTPRPQGSSRVFMHNGKPRITSDNPKLKPYRHTLTQVALLKLQENELQAPLCPRESPVEVTILWTLKRPKSKPSRIKQPISKPDTDKLARAVLDSLTGVAFHDDAQVVSLIGRKQYGLPERTEVMVRTLEALHGQHGAVLKEREDASRITR